MLISYLKNVPVLQHSFVPTLAMAQEQKKIVVGTVVRRRNDEVVEEMAGIARGERARMTAQVEEVAEVARWEKARMTAQAPPTPLC